MDCNIVNFIPLAVAQYSNYLIKNMGSTKMEASVQWRFKMVGTFADVSGKTSILFVVDNLVRLDILLVPGESLLRLFNGEPYVQAGDVIISTEA